MTRPFKSTAADRIALTEASLGRKIWAARELPDDLARALWWKRRRWYFDDRRQSLAEDDPAIFGADDEFHEAQSKHELLIREMWMTRLSDREAREWLKLAAKDLTPAPAFLFTDAATARALEKL